MLFVTQLSSFTRQTLCDHPNDGWVGLIPVMHGNMVYKVNWDKTFSERAVILILSTVVSQFLCGLMNNALATLSQHQILWLLGIAQCHCKTLSVSRFLPLFFRFSAYLACSTFGITSPSWICNKQTCDPLEHQLMIWPVPYTCAQFSPGSGSHGQMFLPFETPQEGITVGQK